MERRKIYCSTTEYLNGPFAGTAYTEGGDEFGSDSLEMWLVQASYLIDHLTHGRASAHAEALSNELAYACGQIAEMLHQHHPSRMAAAGGLSGASNDGYSETYASARNVSAYVRRECYKILEEALGNDPYGLLYLGVE